MDNDGDPDLIVLNGGYEGPYQLGIFENVGSEADSHFRDVTESAGLAGERFRQFWCVQYVSDSFNVILQVNNARILLLCLISNGHYESQMSKPKTNPYC